MSPALRQVGLAVMALALLVLPPARPAGAATLAGGGAIGRGVFVTYADRDTVLEGGTIAAPDLAAPTAQAAIDYTGLGSALAALGHSPYSDAAGVLNAFGGTELPVGSIGERSRARVAGRPPQESTAAGSESAGRARARLEDGPTAEAEASAASALQGGLSARAGGLRATVATVTRAADSRVTVVLREVRIGELRIESIVLTAAARADGAAGRAAAGSVVEGVTVGGTPVRLTPKGFEPAGAGMFDLSWLDRAGVEVLSAGGSVSRPGGRQADARAVGPRLRLRSADGRLLTIALGEAIATSSWEPGPGIGLVHRPER